MTAGRCTRSGKPRSPSKNSPAKSELIRRLADTNGDGTLDESKVFADGFNDVLDGTAAGVFYYEGCLYFACIPKIYMLRDTDGDGAPTSARSWRRDSASASRFPVTT